VDRWTATLLARELAAVAAVEKIDRQADHQPGKETYPSKDRQAGHQQNAKHHAEHRSGDTARGAEAPMAAGIAITQNNRIMTPIETRAKAKSVPMFDKSESVPMSRIPAGMPTTKPAI
jgi:hypothetical protein